MRVIAGTARGRPLRASGTIRPTADRIKGSIFSILEALAYKRGFEPDEEGVLAAALAWPRVLDLFAGSGALGIEALSRGAQHASFVEHDREAARTIEANLRATGLNDRGNVQLAPLHLGLGRVRGPFDLVFADPPYSDAGAVSETVVRLGKTDFLRLTSVVILEQPAADEPPPGVGPLPLSSTRCHGRTRISVYATVE